MYDRTLRRFDTRIISRHIARKIVSRDEYQAFVDAQEDCAHLADQSEVEFVASGKRDDDSADKKG